DGVPPGTSGARLLERPQSEREQNRYGPDEVSGRLLDAVRRDREHEPADERSPARHAEGAEPRAGEAARTYVRQQQEEIPRADRAEERDERPVRQPEGPAGEVHERPHLGLEAVGIAPRRAPAAELVPDEPEAVPALE